MQGPAEPVQRQRRPGRESKTGTGLAEPEKVCAGPSESNLKAGADPSELAVQGRRRPGRESTRPVRVTADNLKAGSSPAESGR